MLARYYGANTARFLSVDPVIGRRSVPQSWNRYVYALDNPLLFNDPDGRAVNPVTKTNTYDVKVPLSSLPTQFKFGTHAAETTGTLKVVNPNITGATTKNPDGTFTATRTLVSADVELTTTTTKPQWVDAAAGSPAQQTEWNRFSAAVDTHETGHQTNQLAGAHVVDAAVDGLTGTGSGATEADALSAANQDLADNTKSVVQSGRAGVDEQDAEYDKRTLHGGTQKAELNSHVK